MSKQAAACRGSLADYLPLYQHRRADLLHDRRDLLTEHPHPVATTVSLAVQRIAERHPAAADLLRLCSFLSPDTLPEELFTQGAAHLGPILTPVASDPFLLNQA